MKRLSFRTAVPFIAAAFAVVLPLAACNGTEAEGDPKEPALVVRVVDSSGAALGVDTVTWSYYGDGGAVMHKAAHGTDSTHKPAARLNAEGSAWAIDHPGLHGSIFLRARYHRSADALCLDHGYVVKEIDAGSLPQDVTLIMTIMRMCE